MGDREDPKQVSGKRINTWYTGKGSWQNQTLGKKRRIWRIQRKQLKNLKKSTDGT